MLVFRLTDTIHFTIYRLTQRVEISEANGRLFLDQCFHTVWSVHMNVDWCVCTFFSQLLQSNVPFHEMTSNNKNVDGLFLSQHCATAIPNSGMLSWKRLQSKTPEQVRLWEDETAAYAALAVSVGLRKIHMGLTFQCLHSDFSLTSWAGHFRNVSRTTNP